MPMLERCLETFTINKQATHQCANNFYWNPLCKANYDIIFD